MLAKEVIEEITKQKENYGKQEIGKGKNVIVEDLHTIHGGIFCCSKSIILAPLDSTNFPVLSKISITSS